MQDSSGPALPVAHVGQSLFKPTPKHTWTRWWVLLLLVLVGAAAGPAMAQRRLYWVGQPLYQNNFQAASSLAEWRLIEDNGTGSWALSDRGTAVLTMDNASGSYANRLQSVSGGSARQLPLDVANGTVEFQVVATTGGNQQIYVQAEEFTSAGVYLGQKTILSTTSATAGFYRILLSATAWNSATTQVRFIIGGANFSAQQGTIEFNYFSYYNTAQTWTNTANWAATSGGVSASVLPTAADTVTFDSGGAANCLLAGTPAVARLQLLASYPAAVIQESTPLAIGAGGLRLAGGALLGGTATITTSSVLLTGGTLQSPSSTLQLSGNFEWTGGSFVANGGTLRFSGAQGQRLRASSAVALASLSIDNSAGVTLEQNASVAGALQLAQGLLTTGSYAVTLGPTATLSESPAQNSYVLGAISATRSIGSGSPTQTFGGLGLTINETTQTSNATAVTRKTGSILSDMGQSSLKRIFTITPTINAGLNANVTYRYIAQDLTAQSPSQLSLYAKTGSAWQVLPTVHDDANFTLQTAALSTLGQLTAASATPLPVSLIELTAQAYPDFHTVRWRTASEKSSAYFEVEKSSDAQLFTFLIRVGGAGSSGQPHTYEIHDELPGTGLTYYRLRQVDTNHFARYYGPVVAYSTTRVTDAVLAYPNPSNGQEMMVEFPAGGCLTVSTLHGQEVFRQQLASDELGGVRQVRFTRPLATGCYVLTVRSAATFQHQRLMVR